MPPPDAPPLTRAVVLRALGFGVAIALGAVAVWLIVVADSTKSIQLGVLAGIWGALLGAFSMFGARRHGLELDESAAVPRSVSDVPVMSTQEIAMRSTGEVERIAEAAARRAFEDRLEQMLRRELSREVGDLRGEIARLRQDLLDKVGGQLRLERIETTRVIGSDLEALQHEVRQLKQASETGTLHELGIGAPPTRVVVEPATVRPVSRPATEARADVRPARAAEQEPAPADDTVSMHAAANGASGNGVNGTAGHVGPGTGTPSGTSSGTSSNGTAGHAASPNGTSPNGTSPNGTSANGTSANGTSANGSARPHAAPTPAETTGPIRLQPLATRPSAPAPVTPPVRTPPVSTAPTATPDPAQTWSPPAAPTTPPPAATAPPATAPPATAPPATAPPAPTPAAATSPVPPPAGATPPAPASADPFASLPRITPFTEFELDPVDTTSARSHPEPPEAAPSGHASPVAPANPAYTGRRRRTDGGDPDAGRHSRHDATPPPAAPPAGRRRRADDDDTEDSEDLLSRLLARGSADH